MPDYPESQIFNWGVLVQPLPLFLLISNFILTGIFWILWKKRDKTEFIWGPKELGAMDQSLRLFYGWVPLILGIHAAIPMIVYGLQGRLFLSGNHLEGFSSHWMGLVEILIGISLFYGGLTRAAAILIAFLWIIAIDCIGPLRTFASIQFLGYAIFFYLAGRGPYAIDRILLPKLEPKPNYANAALLCLRIGIGLTFIYTGLVENIVSIPSETPFIEHHPFLHHVGFSEEVWHFTKGAFEILAGLMLLFGIFPRLVSIIVLICINVALTFSQWNELLDSFPLFAGLAILLVWEPNNPKQKLLWVDGLRKDIDESMQTALF
jgi:uncharacterized membrane protein YphA (DoxX/SURF4 family)